MDREVKEFIAKWKDILTRGSMGEHAWAMLDEMEKLYAGRKAGGAKMKELLSPVDILNIKRQYAEWKSGTNPHYPSDQVWFAQAGAQAYHDSLSNQTPEGLEKEIEEILDCSDNECLYRRGDNPKHCTHCKTVQLQSIIAARELGEEKRGAEMSIKAIDDEPELPGDMPDSSWDAFNSVKYDRKLSEEMLRSIVKDTKQSIKERLMKALEDKE